MRQGKWNITTQIKATLIFLFIPDVLSGQEVRYSTAWFGPNANPVPEIKHAVIPALCTLTAEGDYFFGFGDQTKSIIIGAEIPLLPECVSLSVWNSVFESYSVSEKVRIERDMPAGSYSGRSTGDFYVQIRMKIAREKKYFPSLILNSTLKTASGNKFDERRHYDTPGYYFDLEAGKSFSINSAILSELRLVLDLGFICWETSGSCQDEAPMYGGTLIVGNPKWSLENTMAGYHGWMHSVPRYGTDYGDAPLIYSAKMNIKLPNSIIFLRYQYGISNFPYHLAGIGISLKVHALTPRYGVIRQ